MKLLLTFDRHTGAFVLTQLREGVVVQALETVDLFVVEQEVHRALLLMRHLARGKTYETPQPRSCA